MYCFSGTEQQQINVAPSSESFTNWRAILSPTWPSRELESSSVGDISMRQALENANLLQIIKSTLAGTRTRTMDQTRFLPSLYQGSGNNAPQEPSEVSAETPMRSQDADEMTIVSGLPQINVFSALSPLPSVTHLTTTVSSSIMPYATSSISKDTTSESDIFSTSPSPSSLPLETESPHIIVIPKMTVPPTKVPLTTDIENSFNTANTYFNYHNPQNRTVIAGNSNKTKYATSRKVGREFSIATAFINDFGLARGNPIVLAGKPTDPGYRKLHSPALHAIISSHNSLPLPTDRVPLNSSKTNAFSELIPKRSSVAVLTSQPLDEMTPYKEINSYAAMLPQVHNGKTAVPWISTLALHIPSTPSAQLKIPDLPSASLLVSTEERSLLQASKSSTRLFHLMKNASVPIVPTIGNPEAISLNNAIIQAPAPTATPVSYSTDKAASFIVGKYWTFNTTAHAPIPAPNVKVVSKIHIAHPIDTKSANWVFRKHTSDIAYETAATTPPTSSEPTLWPHNFFLVMKSVRRRSLTKAARAKMFTNDDANRFHLPQSPATHTTNNALKNPASKQAPWTVTLERTLPLESPGSAALSVSLPTSIRGHLTSSSTATLIPSPNYSRNVQLTASHIRSPAVSLREEKGKDARVRTTVTPNARHLSPPSLNKSDAKVNAILHMAEVSSWTTVVPLDINALPSFAPGTEPLRSLASASQEVYNAASKGISDISAVGQVFKPTVSTSASDIGSQQSSSGISVVSGKRVTQAAKDNANPTVSKTAYLEVSVLQQQTNYASKHMPSSSVTSSVNASVTSIQNASASLFTGTKSKGFTEFGTYRLDAETHFDKYSSFPQIQSTFSKGTEVLIPQSKKEINTPGNVLESFTVGNNFTSDSERKFRSTSQYFTASKAGVSTGKDAFFPTLSMHLMHSHTLRHVSYAHSQTVPKPQTPNSEKLFASTNAFNAISSPLSLTSQRDTKLPVPVNNEITSNSVTKATVAPTLDNEVLSSTPILKFPEEYMTPEKRTQFTNSPFSETSNHLSKQPTTFSTGGPYTEGTIGHLDTVVVPKEATPTTPLQAHTINALQSAIITSAHAPSTQLTSSLLPTTNFTHSVITVLPSVSPGVIPSVATSEATPVTGKSARTSPMLTSPLFSLSTENSPSVMALSTLISTLAKNSAATKTAPTLSPVVTHAAFPVVSRDKSTTPVHTTSSFPIAIVSTVLAPTTHAPQQTETTTLDTKKSTSSDITKTSTAYPLTITAALTSITASAKTARLLPTSGENTSAAATTVSTTAFANVTTVLPLECLISSNLLIKTGTNIF